MRRLLVIASLLLVTACSEPPQKEIDEAQRAVDAARAAEAPRYAAAEFTAAAAALEKARAAVDQRDYRQALNSAIDSRQRAAEAARLAGDEKGKAKRAVEAVYGETATRANALQSALRNAEGRGVPPKILKNDQTTLRNARGVLQKASAAISAGNYDEASKMLTEVRGKLDAAAADVQKIPPPAKNSRKRAR